MSREVSTGLLMYRLFQGELQIFLAHPGGPFWSTRDEWGIPKGKVEEGEDEFATACREFEEETGITPPGILGSYCPGGRYFWVGNAYTKKNRKRIGVWAFECHLSDVPKAKSNLTEVEYPKGSGKMIEFPEIDETRFFTIKEARERIHGYQRGLIDQFLKALAHAEDSHRAHNQNTD